MPLSPGDTLLFYTDGVTDTPGDDGALRRAAAARRVDAAPPVPAALLQRLTATLAGFERGTIGDDRAVLVLQYTGAEEAPAAAGRAAA